MAIQKRIEKIDIRQNVEGEFYQWQATIHISGDEKNSCVSVIKVIRCVVLSALLLQLEKYISEQCSMDPKDYQGNVFVNETF